MSVLVLIPNEDAAPTFVAWGHQFAVTRGEKLLLVLPPDAPDLHHTCDRLLQLTDPEAEKLTCQTPDEFRAILTLIQQQQASLVVASTPQQRRDSGIGTQLFQRAPCDVILLRSAPKSGERCDRILIPAAGGHHAQAALRLGDQLAKDEAGVVRALYVAQPSIEDPESTGEAILQHTLEKAGVDTKGHILPEVVVANTLMEGLGAAAQKETDLILVGASEVGLMRRALFGTIPEQILRNNPGTAVAIFRAKPHILTQAQLSLDRLLVRYVPQLARESRIRLYETLQEGSSLSMDFITLICLSTAIASLGLMQNSGAVVIGAMLVAPLMTPMLGTGLGLVQGNLNLVMDASRSILYGFFLSLIIAMGIGFFTPGFRDLTPELLARGSPNILDQAIALLSGSAAAYAMARPGLLAALPGVAIAAALVPPIATAGIALATGHSKVAVGAAFLFGTNLVTIILAAALTLYVLGIRPNQHHHRFKVWAQRALVALAVTALFFTFPLGATLVSQFTQRVDPLRLAIEHQLKDSPNITLGTYSFIQQNQREVLRIEVYSDLPLPGATAKRLADAAAATLQENTPIRVVTLLEWSSKPGAPPPQPPKP